MRLMSRWTMATMLPRVMDATAMTAGRHHPIGRHVEQVHAVNQPQQGHQRRTLGNHRQKRRHRGRAALIDIRRPGVEWDERRA